MQQGSPAVLVDITINTAETGHIHQLCEFLTDYFVAIHAEMKMTHCRYTVLKFIPAQYTGRRGFPLKRLTAK